MNVCIKSKGESDIFNWFWHEATQMLRVNALLMFDTMQCAYAAGPAGDFAAEI